MRTSTLSFIYHLLLAIVFYCDESHQYLYPCNASVACGCSQNSAMVNRIVGGEAAGAGTWGWIVSISIESAYLCGGSILSSTWIVTAAHCVDFATASQVTIYAGSNLRFSGQARSAAKIIVHPDYNATTHENDIALLKLSKALDMTDPNVKVICMPSVSSSVYSSQEWPPANLYVVIIGWGTLSESGPLPNTLQQATVQTIAWDNPNCQNVIVDPIEQLCAGLIEGGKDTCQGDSGGPIMMFTSSYQWVLVGITSYGYGCAQPYYPGVYTRIVYYQEWINNQTGHSYKIATKSSSANINPYLENTTATTTAQPNAAMNVKIQFLSLSVFLFCSSMSFLYEF